MWLGAGGGGRSPARLRCPGGGEAPASPCGPSWLLFMKRSLCVSRAGYVLSLNPKGHLCATACHHHHVTDEETGTQRRKRFPQSHTFPKD